MLQLGKTRFFFLLGWQTFWRMHFIRTTAPLPLTIKVKTNTQSHRICMCTSFSFRALKVAVCCATQHFCCLYFIQSFVIQVSFRFGLYIPWFTNDSVMCFYFSKWNDEIASIRNKINEAFDSFLILQFYLSI